MEQFHDFQYLQLADNTLEHGVVKSDRTGTGTKSTFSNQMRFNISDGSVPILTGKKMHLPSIVTELVDWYIKGDSSAYNLQRRNVRIWNEWADADGNLGPVYGHLWRGWPASDATSITAVRDRGNVGINKDFQFKFKSQYPKSQIGGINAYGQKYTIDATLEDSKNGQLVRYYHVSFDDTGYFMTITNKQRLNGKFRDPYAPNEYGGCIGEGEFRPSYRKRAYDLWNGIMRDVYGTEGAQLNRQGYFVDRDWRCFYNFLLDLPRIPGFYKWLNSDVRYEMTPQYYTAYGYGPQTCVFVPASMLDRETKELEGMKLAIKAVRGNRTILDYNPDRLAKKTGVESEVIMREVRRDVVRELDSGWTFSVTGSPLGSTFRPTLYVDQLEDVIYRLKNNPDDRRLLITAWNPGLVPEMQLPPCHYTFQFYTRPLTDKERMDIYFERTKDSRIYDEYYTWDGTPAMEKLIEQNIPTRALSCMLNQRSADVFLGVPFNIAQYTILTHMIAQVVNMHPDEFIWNGGDTHIYSNHEAQIMEQFQREPFASPKLSLNRSVDKIDDFTYDDIVIEGYQSHGPIKAKVAV